MRLAFALASALALSLCAHGAMVTVNYTVDAGGSNSNPLNGLSARAVFTAVGAELTILLENTSTGVPAGFSVSDSLLTSVAFNLPGLTMAGVSAEVGPGSAGLGQWAARGVGGGVGEQWKWTNAGGGDLLAPYAQVISTVNGSVRGAAGTRFGGGNRTVGGPFGGIATHAPLVNIPKSQFAVGGSIVFGLMLNGTLTD